MAYSHEEYMKHRASYRKAQKKYYEKNKKKICKKYASIRLKWDNAHRKYLNEHACLNAKLKKLVDWPSLAANVMIYKDYLRDLHKRGLI